MNRGHGSRSPVIACRHRHGGKADGQAENGHGHAAPRPPGPRDEDANQGERGRASAAVGRPLERSKRRAEAPQVCPVAEARGDRRQGTHPGDNKRGNRQRRDGSLPRSDQTSALS